MHSSSSHKTPSENYKDWLYNQYDEFPGPDSDDKDQYDEFLGLDSDDELPSKVIDNKLPCSILKEMEVTYTSISNQPCAHNAQAQHGLEHDQY
ncbi:hypothetical protein Tco_1098618 [Tanacetum coccineum]